MARRLSACTGGDSLPQGEIGKTSIGALVPSLHEGRECATRPGKSCARAFKRWGDQEVVELVTAGAARRALEPGRLRQSTAKVAYADFLSDRGVVEASRVYESPDDGVAPEGPEAIFVAGDFDRIFATIDRLNTAVR